eukprot:763143-Hanusia_phi.AAC.2
MMDRGHCEHNFVVIACKDGKRTFAVPMSRVTGGDGDHKHLPFLHSHRFGSKVARLGSHVTMLQTFLSSWSSPKQTYSPPAQVSPAGQSLIPDTEQDLCQEL